MTTFVCTKCGYEFKAEKKPDLCPFCYAPIHHLIPKKDEPDEQPQDSDKD